MLPLPHIALHRWQSTWMRLILGDVIRRHHNLRIGLDLGVWRSRPLRGPVQGDPLAMQVITALALALGARGSRYDRCPGSRNPLQ